MCTEPSGDDYKVSLHGDMTYYPAIAGVEGQVSWRTTSICVGTHELVGSGDVVRHSTDWRYEYRYGQVTHVDDLGPGRSQVVRAHGAMGRMNRLGELLLGSM